MAIAPFLDTKGLTLIPFRYSSERELYGVEEWSGGESHIEPRSPTGTYWLSSAAGNYVKFGFNGPILGILFWRDYGSCGISVDGTTIVDNLDISNIKGSYHNLSYIVTESLFEGNHEAVITANSGNVMIVGALVDKRLNWWDFPLYPRIKRRNYTFWEDYVASSGEHTGTMLIPISSKLGLYMSTSAATTIELKVWTADHWQILKKYTFSAAGRGFAIFDVFPFDKILFRTTNAATITIQVWIKE